MTIRHTDKHLGLILTATCQKFDLDLWAWPWPLSLTLTLTLKQGNSGVQTQFLASDLDLWPTILTYNPNLAKVKVDRSNSSAMRALTHRQTDTTKYIISLASRSISCSSFLAKRYHSGTNWGNTSHKKKMRNPHSPAGICILCTCSLTLSRARALKSQMLHEYLQKIVCNIFKDDNFIPITSYLLQCP